MAYPSAPDFFGKEAKCQDFFINIPPDLPPVDWPECCIYRVPKLLRKVNEEAYTPKLVSIGPFHHGRDELRDMEKHKLRYFKDFLERAKKSPEELLKIIEDNEEKIRLCYSEDCRVLLGSDDFVKMILFDAIFIIELFLKVGDQKETKDEDEVGDQKETKDEDEARRKVKKAKEEKDYILRKIWLGNGIYYDLILLENQLPFFVLENLYMFAFNESSNSNHHEEDAHFVKLSRNYFAYYDRQRKSIGEEVTEEPFDKEATEQAIGEEVKHFTDLLRYLFCPPNREQWTSEEGSLDSSKKEKRRKSGTRFCATKLDNVGLKFKVKNDRRLLDITLPGRLGRFSCFGFSYLFRLYACVLGFFGCPMHILEVPQLVIDYHTEAIFRNLMALEQCHYPSKTYICNYVLLLNHLINTEKDVDLLVDKEIIANRLRSNGAAATLINNLGEQIVATTSSYDHITLQLSKHYEFPLSQLLVALKREYFPNPFTGIATIVGLFLFFYIFLFN